MSEPTSYDLEQDASIQGLRDLVTTVYDPPSSVEASFPVVNAPMDDAEWGALFKAFGSGIISYGQYPYRLILDSDADVSNQVRITPATDLATKDSVGVIEGFAHRLLEDKLLSVPAVTVRTRYIVALQYDPVRAAADGAPVVLDVFSGTLDQSQGKKYVLIYEGYREPSSVLSSVSWVPVRSRLAPSITVQRAEHLPNPQHSGLIWGTRCYCTATDEEYMLQHHPTAEYMRWVNIASPLWDERADTSTYVWPGHGYRLGIQRNGSSRRLRGRVKRSNNAEFSPNNNANGYSIFGQLAPEDRPAQEVSFITPGNGLADTSLVQVRIYKDGWVKAYPASWVNWVSLDGIEFDVA